MDSKPCSVPEFPKRIVIAGLEKTVNRAAPPPGRQIQPPPHFLVDPTETTDILWSDSLLPPRQPRMQAQNRSSQKLKEYLTVGEAAEFLGVSPWTLRNWDRAGKLRPRRHPKNG